MIETFESREAMTEAAKTACLHALRAGVEERGAASCALSGGSTPVPLYEALSETEFDWDKVHVTLADERDAPDDTPARNDKLLREHLLKDYASAAKLTPMVGLDHLPDAFSPLDLIVLGMGDDGHTASLFPNSPGLKEALEGPADEVFKVTPDPLPPGAPYARLTLSRAGLLGARSILLLVTGEKKRAVLEEAMRAGQVEDMPVRAILHADGAPLRVLYAD
ncbi:6-phosphogluconolactonase [Parvularcula dongshanensis]|uniref:6-phosphogluconolactonase n=1 Tax=Parvularcula dongshanensis TaxID=1173995 RepID=A0A840I017_9PROT|nr:6-phosphogluconolactonase [Parvularcula dongshanensis]MBB4658426.1 6-phosphogluconolactonase [Parvularcula dongshanensis]